MVRAFGVALDLSDPLTLVLVVLGIPAVLVGLRFLIAYLNAPGRADDRLERAGRRTLMTVGAVLGGTASAVAIGLVQFGDIVQLVTQFVGGHPFVVSNLGGIALGAGTLAGLLTLTVDQYVGLALALVGAVFLLSEVTESAA